MKLRHKINGGLAEVSDDYGNALVEAGLWEAAEDTETESPTQPPRRPRKTAQKGAQTEK
ncbi:MAG: DUF7302 family protein [Isosphaeraceae bacterium]